ncbi:MAG: LytR C-terminal domain-containing protein [Methylotenera sp.]|nr:LytR C-terminal domain-containing protein [Methylotenera sp.]MDO9232506.1 LytR C-terminal domain-containing protein [Methylotenera sp.]MDO9388761.1 LytR C-terminal domain-containing protein [Methylotenera sp.]MDP2403527.1 LytR C-terminal domain-containing protein [Methylotenera sp.]MDP3095648.1 LytR C-terminal domain-containing protein [Methylotenera sp.]
MKSKQKILPAVCCIALLSACASNQQAVVAPLTITPMIAKNSSDNPKAMYQIGRYYQGQNRFDQAIKAYENALAVDSSFVEARNGLGVIYSRQGKYREAIEAFQIAIQQAPKAAHLYSNMGYAYYLQGRYVESVAALKQAAALDPTNQRALNNLGLAYAKTGGKSESAQAFTQAVNVSVVTAVESQSITRDTVAAPLQNALPLPVEVASVNAEKNVMPVSKLVMQMSEVQKPEIQMLALPNDRGGIRPASTTITIPVVDSRVKLVQVAPNVYELHAKQYNVEPVQVAIVADIPSTAKLRVEVANGNGLAGMAGKVGQFLRHQGYPAARLTNQKPFQVRVTQIQYREGHQAEAQLLQSSLPEAPELVRSHSLRADVSVRLVLGKDMAPHLAHFDGKWQKLQLALTPMLSASKS